MKILGNERPFFKPQDVYRVLFYCKDISMADSGQNNKKGRKEGKREGRKEGGSKAQPSATQKIWNTLIQLYCPPLVESSNFHIPHWHGNYEQKVTKKAYVICQCVFPSGIIWQIKKRPSWFSKYIISVSHHLGAIK